MQALVDSYMCEWTAVVRDPKRRERFRHFANNSDNDDQVEFVIERSQKRPREWPLEIAPLDDTAAHPEAPPPEGWC